MFPSHTFYVCTPYILKWIGTTCKYFWNIYIILWAFYNIAVTPNIIIKWNLQSFLCSLLFRHARLFLWVFCMILNSLTTPLYANKNLGLNHSRECHSLPSAWCFTFIKALLHILIKNQHFNNILLNISTCSYNICQIVIIIYLIKQLCGSNGKVDVDTKTMTALFGWLWLYARCCALDCIAHAFRCALWSRCYY